MYSPAFAELERLVRHLGEELAAFRRRAFLAEARVKELEEEAAPAAEAAEAAKAPRGSEAQTLFPFEMGADESAGRTGDAGTTGGDLATAAVAPVDPAARIAELERENAALRERLAGATTRTRQMLERVRFLRQQSQEASR